MKRYILPLLYMGLIFIQSSIPDYGKQDICSNMFSLLPPTLQNLLHIPEFGLLAYLWMQALYKKDNSLTISLWAAVISISYGLFDEIHQVFVYGRYASLEDFLLDVLGVFLGIVIYKCLRKF